MSEITVRGYVPLPNQKKSDKRIIDGYYPDGRNFRIEGVPADLAEVIKISLERYFDNLEG